MAYVPTTFVDRSVEFPNRRKLTAVSGQADTFDIARAEGTVFAEGTKPDAENLNAEFGKIKTETDAINTSLTAPTVGMFVYDYQNGSHGFNTSPTRGADTFHPFKSAPKVAVNNITPTEDCDAVLIMTCWGSNFQEAAYVDVANNFLEDGVVIASAPYSLSGGQSHNQGNKVVNIQLKAGCTYASSISSATGWTGSFGGGQNFIIY